MEQQYRLIQQALQGKSLSNNSRLRNIAQIHFVAVVRFVIEQDDGWLGGFLRFPDKVQHAHVLQMRVQNNGIGAVSLENRQGLLSARGCDDLDVFTPDYRFQIVSKSALSYDQQLPNAPMHGVLNGTEGLVDGAAHGLLQVGHRTERQPAATIVVTGDHVNGNVTRGWIVLETIQNSPT